MNAPLVEQLRHLGARNSLSGSSLAAREAMAEAAELIENLGAVRSASDVEKGWRLFWGGFSRHLDLTHKQRTYTWHELMDACRAGMHAAGVVSDDPESFVAPAQPTGDVEGLEFVKRLREIADNYGGHPKETLDEFADDLEAAIIRLNSRLSEVEQKRAELQEAFDQHFHDQGEIAYVGIRDYAGMQSRAEAAEARVAELEKARTEDLSLLGSCASQFRTSSSEAHQRLVDKIDVRLRAALSTVAGEEKQ